jgi:hypothetical protein
MALTKVTNSMQNSEIASVLDYGADPTGVTDSTTAIQNCINSNPVVLIPLGTYSITTINVPLNKRIIGQRDEMYGEFTSAAGTTSKLQTTAAAGNFAITIPNSAKNISFEHLEISGDNTNNGILIGETVREISMDQVSIKNVSKGIEADNFFFSNLRFVTVECQDIGFHFRGEVTTMTLQNCIVQGDKNNSVRCNAGFQMDLSGVSTGSAKSFTMIGCAAQFCVDCFRVGASTLIGGSPNILIDSFNAEDFTNSFMKFSGINELPDIQFNNLLVLQPDATSYFEFDGEFRSRGNIFIYSLFENQAWTSNTPGTRLFAKTGTNFVSFAGKLLLPEVEYDVYRRNGGFDSNLGDQRRNIGVIKMMTGERPDAIQLTGSTSYSIPIDDIAALYSQSNIQSFANKLLNGQNAGQFFGNGMIYKITSNDINSPYGTEVSYFSLRTIAGSERFAINNVVGTLSGSVSFDAIDLEIDVTSASAAKYFLISTGI